MPNQLYLFGGHDNDLPEQPSPKITLKNKSKTGFLHTCMPPITARDTSKWTHESADLLRKRYIQYVAKIAQCRNWRAGKNVTAQLLTCLNLTEEFLDAHQQLNRDHAAATRQKLKTSLQSARKAMVRAMAHLYQAPDKAMLLEPLFYLLFWDKQVRDYFVQQTDLYTKTTQTHPLLWGRYKYFPRVFIGFGIRRTGQLWQEILPHQWPQVRDKKTGKIKTPARWRTPMVRASFGLKKPTPAQIKQLLKSHFPVYKQQRTSTESLPF